MYWTVLLGTGFTFSTDRLSWYFIADYVLPKKLTGQIFSLALYHLPCELCTSSIRRVDIKCLLRTQSNLRKIRYKFRTFCCDLWQRKHSISAIELYSKSFIYYNSYRSTPMMRASGGLISVICDHWNAFANFQVPFPQKYETLDLFSLNSFLMTKSGVPLDQWVFFVIQTFSEIWITKDNVWWNFTLDLIIHVPAEFLAYNGALLPTGIILAKGLDYILTAFCY